MSLDSFEAIRPYRDSEVPAVVERLMESEALIQGIIHLRYPKVPRYLEKPLTRFVRYRLHQALGNVSTVAEFQELMGTFLEKTIDNTMTEFTCGGVESLAPGQPYVFISNHRDITLDSALLNYSLFKNGHESAEIAIGDNLLVNPLVADMLRLNKSFVVNRSAKGIKEKFAALTELSRYIFHTHENQRSVWIAQREGRAKNGEDVTDPAILKMLHVWAKKQGMSFSDTMRHFRIVPVSVSYEYDPCDGLKAAELAARDQAAVSEQDYIKSNAEDFESIMRGISQPKGRVHLQFGDVLSGDYETPAAAASAIDEQIVSNYRLYPSNWFACDQLLTRQQPLKALRELSAEKLQHWLQTARLSQSQMNLSAQDLAQQAREFRERLSAYSEQVQQYILEMYANPVINKYRYQP
ncbi:MAG: 1-acyl-sn-glycerol-3-phosphate acyltransferase [Ketobacteraceae bacterium]|nr:1-acyl-sn-glycerol-3-phosphate acyltransferase [Ketobacteraceae bacterium]